MIDFYLSMADLALIDGFLETYGAGDKKGIDEVLYTNGMDVSKEVEEIYCTHRTLQGKIFTGIRYEGFERSDPEWLKNPACSWENKVAACDDPHLRIQLGAMGKQANFTGSLIDHMKKHSKVKEDI